MPPPRPVTLTVTVDRAALNAMDQTIDYLSERWSLIVPSYLFAMLPFSLAILFLIDTLSSLHRSHLPLACLLLTGASLWRWIWLAVLQRTVQNELRGSQALSVWKRLPAILFTRILCSFGLTWGGFLILSSFYALFLAMMAPCLFMEEEGRVLPQLRTALSYINKASWRLLKISLSLALAGLLALLATLALQYQMVTMILPGFFGLDTSSLMLTLTGSTWLLSWLYLLFLPFDLLLTVGGVMLFYDLQARRLGSDLRQQIQALEETNP